MAQPTYAQASSPNGSGASLTATDVQARMVQLLAVLASGQNPDGTAYALPTTASIVGDATTGTKSTVVANTVSTTLLAGNANRKGAIISNDSTAPLYVDLSGGTASTSSYSLLVPAAIGSGASKVVYNFEVPFPVYSGTITGVWSTTNGNAFVTELT